MILFEEEVSTLEQLVAQQISGSVVFYGSSTVRLWTSLEQDFPQVHVVNAGFGGSTLEACAWYFERLIVPAHPGAVVIYAGDNDLGENRQPEEVLMSFRTLVDKMQQFLPGVLLWFIAIKPSPARWSIIDRIRMTNTLIAAEIEHIPYATFVDLSAVMLTEQGQPRSELYEADGLHLNTHGYALWKQELMKQCTALQSPLPTKAAPVI